MESLTLINTSIELDQGTVKLYSLNILLSITLVAYPIKFASGVRYQFNYRYNLINLHY